MAAVPPAFARGALRADAPRRAHYGRVFDVAFCPWDDSLFATAGEDETARVWRDETRARSGARAGVASHGACRGHRDEVVRVAWHPTMTILATGSADGTACLWRVAQPGAGGASAHDPDAGAIARVDVLGGHPEEVYGCAFVGDGSGGGPVLATASGTDLRLWDLESAKVVQTAPSPRATRDGPGRPEARPPGSSENENENERGGSVVPERWRPGYLMSLASDAGARGLLASACTDGSVKVWALDQPGRSATPIASLPWHDGAMVTATAFASDGDVLVSADSAGVVCATDVRTWTQTRRIKAPRGVYGICAAPNGVPWVAMCGGDGVVRAAPAEAAGGDRTVALAVAESSGEDAARLLCCAIDASGTRVAAAGWAPEAEGEGPGDPPGPSNARGPLSMKASAAAAGPFGAKKRNAPPPNPIHLWDAAARAGDA